MGIDGMTLLFAVGWFFAIWGFAGAIGMSTPKWTACIAAGAFLIGASGVLSQ